MRWHLKKSTSSLTDELIFRVVSFIYFWHMQRSVTQMLQLRYFTFFFFCKLYEQMIVMSTMAQKMLAVVTTRTSGDVGTLREVA